MDASPPEETPAEETAAVPAGLEAGAFPSKQQQNDEATAPLDDQERRAVQKRLQRKADEKKAELMANSGAMSVRERRPEAAASGAYTPKGSWLSGRLTGRRTGALSSRLGALSSRSAAMSSRSMMSTSRSMMTTARSDVATGRYNDIADPEITETRILEMRKEAHAVEEEHRRRLAARSGKTPRTGKSGSNTATALRAGLLRRGAQLRAGRSSTGRTPRSNTTGRTPRSSSQLPTRQPGERPTHGG